MPFYFNEIAFRGGATRDFAEVAIPVGADPSTVVIYHYDTDGSIQATYNLGDFTPIATTGGHDLYHIDVFALNIHDGLAIVVDGAPQEFFAFSGAMATPTEGPYDGIDPVLLGTATNGSQSFQRQPDGSFAVGTRTEAAGPYTVLPCFLKGTPICAQGGKHKRIENLNKGDLVKAKNNHLQPIAMIAKSSIRHDDPGYVKNLPICIFAHALGKNNPSIDVYVSPNHRILLRNGQFITDFNSRHILVPARYLIGYNGVKKVLPEDQNIHYFYLILESHEVVETKGMLSETFYLDEYSVQRLRDLDKKRLEKLLF